LIAGLSSSASAGPIGWTSRRCALDFGAFAGFLGVLGFFAMGRIWDESGVQKRAFGTCALLCQQVSARPMPDAIHGVWRECITNRHCEPTGRANARPMTGSAKQSTREGGKMDCFAPLARTAG
jgi:hypothetical protein